MSRMHSKDSIDTAMQSEVFLTLFVVVLLLFVVVIFVYQSSVDMLNEAKVSLLAAEEEKNKAYELLEEANRKQQPPLILLDEAQGFIFSRGEAALSEQFRVSLEQDIAPKIAWLSEKFHCDIVEVFGHADGKQYEASEVKRPQDFDLLFHQGLVDGDVSKVAAFSNLELGIVRAGVVVNYLEGMRLSGQLGNVKIVRPYTSGQVIGIDGKIENPAYRFDQPKRRRIEIRISRSSDHNKVINGDVIKEGW